MLDDDRTDETTDERGALELLGGLLDGSARLLRDDLTTSDEAARLETDLSLETLTLETLTLEKATLETVTLETAALDD